MYANNGVGLAAPQVGETLRLIVLDVHQGENGGQLLKLINPRITEKEGKRKSEEGCLSLPGLIVEVDRAEKVVVEALGPDGNEKRIEAEGLLSVALQHEIDHLDGVLLVDRLSVLRRNLYQKRRLREETETVGT
jgi:peptide deformylase